MRILQALGGRLPPVHDLVKTMDLRVLAPSVLTRHSLDEKCAVTDTCGGL